MIVATVDLGWVVKLVGPEGTGLTSDLFRGRYECPVELVGHLGALTLQDG
jgi:hypothetical protein